ncbi:unnamed protein product [Linum tenue]|uniref:Bifunctional inhibitor/plant lipid transfer protein/seed storage helical domain-containing protein n=1 Tax=Linum tenue TaxID=586396 RepID=A0AAV0RW60_9ROSI|nr:unnamed protein product [Linum tenue]
MKLASMILAVLSSYSALLLLPNLPISTASVVPAFARPSSPFRPLCVSQLALANYACASVIPTLPFTDPPMPTATSIPQPSDILFHVAATEDGGRRNRDPTTGREGEAIGGRRSNDGDDDRQKQRHHRNHRSSSSSSSRDEPGSGRRRDGHRHRRGRHSNNGHGRRRGDDDDNDDDEDGGGGGGGMERDQRPASPAENNCCKWVGDVDDECVCELLFRLPTFLARPIHEYTIIVSEWCKITYSCGGRPRP